MGKRIIIWTLGFFLLNACTKEKVCTGVSMNSNDRPEFVGKWVWYKTRIREWFDVGPDVFYDYTPSTEGFDYYFTLSSDGRFKGYHNGVLKHDYVLSHITYEHYGSNFNTLIFNHDCTTLELGMSIPIISNGDSLSLEELPLKFTDLENKRETVINYFVKE